MTLKRTNDFVSTHQHCGAPRGMHSRADSPEGEDMLTERIANFVGGVRTGDIPREALDKARLGMTDFLGVAAAGSREESSRIIRDYGNAMGGAAKATIIATDRKTSPEMAALINGTMGHALDYDDMSVAPIAHPSVFLAPAILAVGEGIDAPGREVLAAYVVGYEVACSIAEPMFQSHYVQGWHSTSTFGSLGAAAAVAWLLKLTPRQVTMAMGIAASLACGLRQNFGTMTKPLHAGRAGANGIQAAVLARAGFTADAGIIEAPLGFARVMGHKAEVDWAAAGSSLGKTFMITGPVGLAIKPYPSCGFTHAAIDCALDVRKQGAPAGEIAAIELGTSPFDRQLLIHHHPATGLEGKFSLEYCVARALASGAVRLHHFSDEAVRDADVLGLMGRMKWVEKFPMPVMGTPEGFGTKSVTVTLANGKKLDSTARVAKGMPTNPLSADEFNAKYRDCASRGLPREAVEESLSMLTDMQEVDTVRTIMGSIAQPPPPAHHTVMPR
ncbi:MAG: MmgE/PrpD family protein [Syntrophales bacterium]